VAHRRPGALEQEVLAVLVAAGAPLTPAEVKERLSGELAYTTVLTALSRLFDKGAVTRVSAGRGYAYSFAADTATLQARQMRRLLDKGTDRRSVLASFVAELDPADEAVLSALLLEGRTEPA
jgi:predicted transcriptional regulator